MSEAEEDSFVEPDNHLAHVLPLMYMKTSYQQYRSGVPSVFVADENVGPFWWGFIMKTPLKGIISLKASQLHESGILSHIMKAAFIEDFRMKPEAVGPQVLTMQHLAAGFVVFLCLLAFSVAVFAFELAPKLLKMLLTWLEKAVFCCVVVKFTRTNKLM
jgi:hypothetical protein